MGEFGQGEEWSRAMGFVTKDSGERVTYSSGMKRDVDAGKPRYDLIPPAMLRRLADLYARGSVKYGDRNWEKANTAEERDRFKASAFRHFMAWIEGLDTGEDEAVATVWNVFAFETIKEQVEGEA